MADNIASQLGERKYRINVKGIRQEILPVVHKRKDGNVGGFKTRLIKYPENPIIKKQHPVAPPYKAIYKAMPIDPVDKVSGEVKKRYRINVKGIRQEILPVVHK